MNIRRDALLTEFNSPPNLVRDKGIYSTRAGSILTSAGPAWDLKVPRKEPDWYMTSLFAPYFSQGQVRSYHTSYTFSSKYSLRNSSVPKCRHPHDMHLYPCALSRGASQSQVLVHDKIGLTSHPSSAVPFGLRKVRSRKKASTTIARDSCN